MISFNEIGSKFAEFLAGLAEYAEIIERKPLEHFVDAVFIQSSKIADIVWMVDFLNLLIHHITPINWFDFSAVLSETIWTYF